MTKLSEHPNAIVGGLLGGGALGQAVLETLVGFGVHLSSRQSGLVTAGCAIAVLLFAKQIKAATAWLGQAAAGTAHGASVPAAGAGTLTDATFAELIAELSARLDAAGAPGKPTLG